MNDPFTMFPCNTVVESCNLQSNSLDSVNVPFLIVYNGKIFIYLLFIPIVFPGSCGLCDAQGFASLLEVQSHRDAHHSQSKNTCEYCGKQFVNLERLKRHVTGVHLQLRPFHCQSCGIRFKRKEFLRNHVMSKHSVRR